MLPWSAELAGRIDEHVITSELLRANPLGDPAERPLWVYLPPGYDDEPARPYPSVYVIQGYTGHVAMWRNRSAYRQPFPETADAVFASGQAPPAIVVYVDAWTGYGGSQFVDSPGTGRYHSYLCDEVVPWVDARYRTVADAGAPGDHGQVQRRVRGDDHAHAPARPVRRAGHPRRRLAVRVQLHPRVRQGRAATCATTTGTSGAGGPTSGPAPPSPRRPTQVLVMMLGVSACFSADPDGTVRAAVRPAHRGAAPGGVAALAGLGPGPDGAPPRGPAAVAAGGLDRRGHQGRVVPRHRRGGVPRGAARRRACPTR